MSGESRGKGDSTRVVPPPTPASETQATLASHPVAELRAVFQSETSQMQTLSLYGASDVVVVGRASGCDWQLEDLSLSRRHAQFRWSGRDLTVEDLGSANGVRLGGKRITGPTPIVAEQPVQLGTVIVTLHLHGKVALEAQATRLVDAPAAPAVASGDEQPLHAAPTVMRASPEPPAASAVKPAASVFRPPQNSARPDEPTRSWDLQAALFHPPERTIDATELVVRLQTIWQTRRRLMLLCGAVIWMSALVVFLSLYGDQPGGDGPLVSNSSSSATRSQTGAVATRPMVSPLPGAVPVPSPVPDAGALFDRDAVLGDAVAAYEQGKLQEARGLFRRLASDPGDTAARFMVDLLSARIDSRSNGKSTP